MTIIHKKTELSKMFHLFFVMAAFAFGVTISGCGFAEDSAVHLPSSGNAEGAGSEAVQSDDASAGTDAVPEILVVHVCGAVASPDVYRFKAGARICDAVRAAGGFAEDAAGDTINQAQFLTDGQKLYIPTEDEAGTQTVSGDLVSDRSEKASGTSDDNRVNINTADQAGLMTIPGIGETRARAIIEYRETSGGFRDPEDIKNVSGIKEGTFSKIRDYIRVD